MRTNIKSISLLSLLAMVLFVGACKKDTSSTPASTAMGALYFHLHTDVDSNEVDNYGDIYTTSLGRKISVNLAQMYITNIQMIKTDGTIYSIPNRILLKQMQTEEYFIANIPTGTYKSVRFDVGLDTTDNAKAATADTSLNHSEMWFGSAAQPGGYVFVNFQGMIDTTTNATGTAAQMQPFMYMLGTEAHLQQITMPDHSPVYTVDTTVATYVHINVDYNKLFTGVQLNNSANLMIHTAADNASTLGNTINNNIATLFTYEE
jgi:hypothetical protein